MFHFPSCVTKFPQVLEYLVWRYFIVSYIGCHWLQWLPFVSNIFSASGELSFSSDKFVKSCIMLFKYIELSWYCRLFSFRYNSAWESLAKKTLVHGSFNFSLIWPFTPPPGRGTLNGAKRIRTNLRTWKTSVP